jgi:hypothetical protein
MSSVLVTVHDSAGRSDLTESMHDRGVRHFPVADQPQFMR